MACRMHAPRSIGSFERIDQEEWMKRIASSVVMALFLFSMSALAADSKTEEKEAVKQCKTEYSEAKKMAGEKKTRHERSEAKKEAKAKYKECVEKAKHKS